MGKGLLGLLKLHLIAKVQFCRFTTGPDLSNRGVFFKAALPSPDVKKCELLCLVPMLRNVTKMGQHG